MEDDGKDVEDEEDGFDNPGGGCVCVCVCECVCVCVCVCVSKCTY